MSLDIFKKGDYIVITMKLKGSKGLKKNYCYKVALSNQTLVVEDKEIYGSKYSYEDHGIGWRYATPVEKMYYEHYGEPFNISKIGLDDKISQTYYVKPEYYKSDTYNTDTSGFDVIDAIKMFGLNFNLGNVLKYITRAGKKDYKKTKEDLEKAKEYIIREIEWVSKKEENEL